MMLASVLYTLLSVLLNGIYYYNVVTSLFTIKSIKHKQTYSYDRERKETFCILIPCHNEQNVIQKNLAAISNSTYDKDLYKVYVIADNCTDNTVAKVKEFMSAAPNMNIEVLEVKGGTKPKAINKAIQELKKRGEWNEDNIVFLDADNQCSPKMLESFNYYHKYNAIVQCRIESENADNIVSRGFKSAFNNMRYGFQLARNNMGLSGSLCGTGFSVNREVFDEVGFEDCTTLTEDLEFSIKAILAGYKIKFIDEQYVLNQNVSKTMPSLKQRLRWNRGHSQTMMKLAPGLLKAFIKKPSLQIFDTIIFLCTPAKSVLYLLMLLLQFTAIAGGSYMAPVLFAISLLYQFTFCLLCNDWKVSYIIPFVKYAIEMIPLMVYGALTYKKTIWVKTEHK